MSHQLTKCSECTRLSHWLTKCSGCTRPTWGSNSNVPCDASPRGILVMARASATFTGGASPAGSPGTWSMALRYAGLGEVVSDGVQGHCSERGSRRSSNVRRG